jgi:hypothetical protein
MARRTFDMIGITETLVHWHQGSSKNEITQYSLGNPREGSRRDAADRVPCPAARASPRLLLAR